MSEKYAQFDTSSIVSSSGISFRGHKFRKRDLILGVALVVCLVVIIILAALLAASNSNNNNNDDAPRTGKQQGNATQDSTNPPPPPTTRPTTLPPTPHCPDPPVSNCTPASQCFSPACLRTAAHATELMNKTVQACDDFHSFACGNFPMLHPLSHDEAETTTFHLIHNKNMDRLRDLLEQAQDPGTAIYSQHWETKLRTFFSSCTDHFTKMQLRGQPLVQQLRDTVGGWWALKGDDMWSNDAFDFQEQLEKVHVDMWTDAFFTFHLTTDRLDWNKFIIQIDISGMGLRSDVYNDPRYAPYLTNYTKFMRTVGRLQLRDSGLSLNQTEIDQRVETFVNDAFTVESHLGRIKDSSPSTPDAHELQNRVTLGELNQLTGNAIDWLSFFKYMFGEKQISQNTYVVVLEQDYLTNFTAWMNGLDAANKTRMLNNYMVWRVMDAYAQDLSWDYIHAYRQVYVDFGGPADFQDTWKYCLYSLDRDMTEALGALFIRNHFSEQNRQTAHDMTDRVKEALMDSVRNSDWISDSTKPLAIAKLNESLIKLGYPDFMMQDSTINDVYEQLTVTDSYFDNLMNLNAFRKRLWTHRLTNPGDRTVWSYATYDFVAAYYNPWKELLIPAGLLQFPIYDHTSPGYTNFGSMGSIVARQLIHSIDEIGNYYNLTGSNYGAWWSNETTAQYTAVRQCVMDTLNNTMMGPFFQGLKVKLDVDYYAPLALGESSGLELAYQAYKKWQQDTSPELSMPGAAYTNDQMFFVSFAQTYCSTRDPLYGYFKTNRGQIPTERTKVNAAVSHVQEFQTAFGCPNSAKMVAPKRCGLW